MGEHAEEALDQLLNGEREDYWLDDEPRRPPVGYAAPELKPAAPEDFPLV